MSEMNGKMLLRSISSLAFVVRIAVEANRL